ncbi:MAG: ribonuclease III [Melioribacteraceae bacterium]|nr:ribonuclease III [Melioribacteraceae bacterium]MCF8352833.1 ribonuclease III [Melioribacteraceae bacterium]MCF8393447.1 ribonuclease III [Melioribacteraceae bacterium]MCF8417350.1 ribonuclease III [Melioribacteraceae bacterium]
MNLFSWLKKITGKSKNNSFEEFSGLKLSKLISLLGYKPENLSLYIKAFTHKSYLDISDNLTKSNQRLEYLGDSVLNLVIGEYLFLHYPESDEGFLTKKRSLLVNKDALSTAADKMNLHELILYDTRYINSWDDGMIGISADCVESLIGAIYLDKGLMSAHQFITKWMIPINLDELIFPEDKNYKGKLLELAHLNKMGNPIYNMISEEGPDHRKWFTIEVMINNKKMGTGQGKNKKIAEQKAAQKAFSKLSNLLKS